MYKRLVVFGDSNTFGHGLDDCWNPHDNGPGPRPSRHAWPSVLAKRLGIDCVNRSKPGASGKEMVYHFMEYTDALRLGDLVIFLWPHFSRSCLMHPTKQYVHAAWIPTQIRATINDKTNKAYYKHVYNEYDAVFNLLMYSTLVKNICDNKNIMNIQFSMYPKSELVDLTPAIDPGIKRSLQNILAQPDCQRLIRMDNQTANDGCHPSKGWHEIIARKLQGLIESHIKRTAAN